MNVTVSLVAVYATVVEIAALGIGRLGVVSARRWTRTADERVMAWPHVGSIALHRVVEAVATAAAVLLASVIALTDRGAPDVAVLGFPIVFGLLMLVRTAVRTARSVRDAD